MNDWQNDRIGSALRGKNPMVMARMKSGFACFGDLQLLPGYCVLLVDDQAITHLSDLDLPRQRDFLFDMALLGTAVETALQGADLRRMNYEIEGNALAVLHAHVRARYEWEDEELVKWPVSSYPREVLFSPEHQYVETKHGELRAAITQELERLIKPPSNCYR